MSDYNQLTLFAPKDALTTGDPDKAALGAEVDAELDAIAVAIATKLDSSAQSSGLASGVYTPTVSNTTNVAASTPRQSQYLRVGEVVTVFGRVSVDPTAFTPTTTILSLSLPVASNLGSENNLNGLAVSESDLNTAAFIKGDSTNDVAVLQFEAGNAAAVDLHFSFSYRVI